MVLKLGHLPKGKYTVDWSVFEHRVLEKIFWISRQIEQRKGGVWFLAGSGELHNLWASSDVVTNDQWKRLKWEVKGKGVGKFQPRTSHKVPEGVKLLPFSSFNFGARWGWCSTPRPGFFNPGNEILYPWYRKLVGPQGRSGWVQKISPSTKIRYPDRPARSE